MKIMNPLNNARLIDVGLLTAIVATACFTAITVPLSLQKGSDCSKTGL
jgi:hypothetical protein